MEYTKAEAAVITLDGFVSLEYKRKAEILQLYKKPQDIFEDVTPAVNYLKENCSGENGLSSEFFAKSFTLGRFYKIAEKLESKNVTVITCYSKDYPEIFKHMRGAPLALYCKGRSELLTAEHKIGVVGSRKTLPFVLKKCEQICEELAGSGAVIVSGSAIGGDRSALLGGLKSGNVISVTASGFDCVSPESNRELLNKIASSGLLISEYPPEVPAVGWHYPLRNRIIAALSDCAFIISGDENSGTRYTVQYAEALSKRIYAFPYSIGERSGALCNHLIKVGKASLVEEAEDIAAGENVNLGGGESLNLEPEEEEIVSALDGEKTVDELVEATGKKAYEIMPVLSMLEIKGVCSRGAGNTWTVIKRKK